MVLYYIKQFNETSQLRVVPTLYDSGLRFGDYDGIVEIELPQSEINRLNSLFYYRKSDYAVDASKFKYPLDSYSDVASPPPEHHTPYKDIGTGLMEQMAYDLTGNVMDVASFENIAELRLSIEEAIKGMKNGQIYKLEKQGTKAKPIGKENSVVFSLLEQFEKAGVKSRRRQKSSNEWQAFQFHDDDCLAFNFTFLSPGKLNDKSWTDVAKNKKGTNITYSIRLKFGKCCNTTANNAEIYDEYGGSK